ncbi:UNVERIFIED_CONTAM: iron-sulfur cluster assembly scaffold protein [Campylobacter lari]
MSYSNFEKRDIIMNHYLHPDNKRDIIENKIIKYGESCADYLEFSYKIKDNKITDLFFNGSGCSFFIASTDILCSMLNNKDVDELYSFLQMYQNLIEGKQLNEQDLNNLGELAIFDNVHKHYNRLNCSLMLVRPLLEDLKKHV